MVSGAEDAVDAVVRTLKERGHRTKRLRVSHAFPLTAPPAHAG
ncbi:hypothetical protein SSOG_08435 [Streptomyces himastatinicus ATCC 53653]|uniref:Uncharacterized protein n=1 Tax=Streptomyces himastatinicus ATCC 53653 TaxID=457427 RepID=D9W7E1_9ACTN|nr:hypothetical protein SSOG_08435 [Streptomyces himastatinicus ATCC 53653]